MNRHSTVVMTRPTAFAVHYIINPWMQPAQWEHAPEFLRHRAQHCWQQLHDAMLSQDIAIHLLQPVEGLPDLVFPANGAVVFDRKVLLSRFAHPQRRQEEPVFRAFFEQLLQRGEIDELSSMPRGIIQEGAGDCLWDAHRDCFWSGFGQRSQRAGSGAIAWYFDCEVLPLELTDPRFYHLDVALAVLEKGELLYYPDAFSRQALATLRERVPPEHRIEISAEDAAGFCANIVSLNGSLFMTPPGETLRRRLLERGYRLHEMDLQPFLLSGGAAACLTLRLDLQRNPRTGANHGDQRHVSYQ